MRDLTDLHIRAMTAPAGQRLLGVGQLLWMAEISQLRRDQLGDAASKVPTRNSPDRLLRLRRAASRPTSVTSIATRRKKPACCWAGNRARPARR